MMTTTTEPTITTNDNDSNFHLLSPIKSSSNNNNNNINLLSTSTTTVATSTTNNTNNTNNNNVLLNNHHDDTIVVVADNDHQDARRDEAVDHQSSPSSTITNNNNNNTTTITTNNTINTNTINNRPLIHPLASLVNQLIIDVNDPNNNITNGSSDDIDDRSSITQQSLPQTPITANTLDDDDESLFNSHNNNSHNSNNNNNNTTTNATINANDNANTTDFSLHFPQYFNNQDPKSLLFQYCLLGQDREQDFIQLLNQQLELASANNQNSSQNILTTSLGNISLDANRLLTSQFIYHDLDKCNLFQLACKYNRVTLLEYMLEILPSIFTFKDSKQANCLFYAVSNNSLEAAALVCNCARLQQLATTDKNKPLLVNELDMYGNCCLYLALQKQNVEMADLLLLFGANIDISFKTGETMLHRAITERRLDIVEYLSKKGANLLKQNQNNENPLFNVFVHQKKKDKTTTPTPVTPNTTATADSIRVDSPTNSSSSLGGVGGGFGSGTLFSSNNSNFCKNGAQFLQNLLKSSNAFSNEVIMKGLKQKNSHGRTMFQECIVRGDLPSFKVLIAYLTTLKENSEQTLSWFVNDVENQKKRTSLHLSVAAKQFHMCKILVDAIPGIAKLDTLDSDGKTAMDLARESNQENTVQFLKEIQQMEKENKKKKGSGGGGNGENGGTNSGESGLRRLLRRFKK